MYNREWDDIMDTKDPAKGKEFFNIAARLNGRSKYLAGLFG
jgi:hypothetical protein